MGYRQSHLPGATCLVSTEFRFVLLIGPAFENRAVWWSGSQR
jgi:hypothetical protein